MKRLKGEGTICLRADGNYMAMASLGRDPLTGKRRRLTVYAKTPAEAKEKLVAALKRWHEKPPLTGHTVETWSAEWLKYLEVARGLKESTRQTYEEKLRLHVIPALGAVKLEDLTGADIDRTVRAWASAGMSARMREMCFGTLRSLLIYAVQKDKIPSSPHLKADRMAKVRPPQRDLWTAEQLERFQLVNPEPLWRFLLVTGCRLGEALGLTWGNVDLAGSSVRISRQLGKDGLLASPKTPKSVRSIALDSGTVGMLSRLYDEARALAAVCADAPVFVTSTGGFGDRSNARLRFARACSAAGVPLIRLHDLRHTCATHMLRSGVSPDAVAARLGHADISVTLSIYSHLSPKQHQDAANVAGTLSIP